MTIRRIRKDVVGDRAMIRRMDIDWGLEDLPLELESLSPIGMDMDCDDLFSCPSGMETGMRHFPNHCS